ncbi:MAG TPA: DEAD/DEAH box helicase, partial [Methanomethylovorans sp.]|nr:DEAD/DEAH box helicase [Methanomethylovorans sp.]
MSEELESLRGDKNIRIVPLYGGQAIKNQLKTLTSGADIVVGTPGRIIDHLKRGNIKLDSVSYLVLDEADEMLNMGFIEDVKEIFRSTNENKQMLLFSATMPTPIIKLAKKHMRNHDYVSVSQEDLIAEFTDQVWFELTEEQKFEALCRLIDINDGFYGLVFCNTKSDTVEIA